MNRFMPGEKENFRKNYTIIGGIPRAILSQVTNESASIDVRPRYDHNDSMCDFTLFKISRVVDHEE